MAVKPKKQEAVDPEVNIAALIDCSFLLLIFFVLQPFKVPEERMDAYLPKSAGGKAAASKPKDIPKPDIKVMIYATGRTTASFKVANTEYEDGNNVAVALTKESGGDKTFPVTIVPGPTVVFKHVIKVLDACAAVGMTEVRFGASF